MRDTDSGGRDRLGHLLSFIIGAYGSNRASLGRTKGGEGGARGGEGTSRTIDDGEVERRSPRHLNASRGFCALSDVF